MDQTERTQRPGESDAAFVRRLRQYDDEVAAYRALLALDAGGMSSWRWDIATNVVTGDACWAEIWQIDEADQERGVDLSVQMDRIHPDDQAAVEAEIIGTLQTDGEFEVEFRVREGNADASACLHETLPDDADWRWLGGRGRVSHRSDDGAPLVLLGVNWDLTEHKRQQENLALLAAEMDHRVKNSFAVTRALITIGEREATDVASFAADLRAQVQAMADAHAVSTRLARRRGEPRPRVPVDEVVHSALAPWSEGRTGAISVRTPLAPADPASSGSPGKPALPPRKVSALAMLTYELATNAAKYGPLGGHAGSLRVEIAWEDEATCRLAWTEACEGEPFVHASMDPGAATSGFGSVLIQHTTRTLGATMDRTLRPEGIAYVFRFPASVEDADGTPGKQPVPGT